MKTFPDIHPHAFVHQRDRAALDTLRSVPGIDTFLRRVSSGTIEGQMRLERMANTLRLGPTQYPSLYAMVERACAVLDVPVPEVYLDSGYTINAWAFGFESYTVTLYSGLVDLLREEEIQAVVGHEIGHIACEHMLYKSSADVLRMLGSALLKKYFGGVAELALAPIELALLTWSRAAEYSCDRAALLVVQDPEVVASALASIGGGASLRWRDEFSMESLIAQAEELEAATTREGVMAQALDAARQLTTTHPDPIDRAREILRWSRGPEYELICAGKYDTRSKVAQLPGIVGVRTCPSCAAAVEDDWKFCKRCGGGLE